MNEHEIQFRQLVDGLTIDVQPRAGHREQLRGQMLAVYREKSSSRGHGIEAVWSFIMKSKAAQGAIAAVVVLGILLSWMALADKKDAGTVAEGGPEREIVLPEGQQQAQTEAAKLAAELALAEQLFAAGDVKGLAALFDSGTTQTKLAVVNYLSKLGTPEAIEALRTLNVADAETTVQEAVQKALQEVQTRQDAAEKTAEEPNMVGQDGQAAIAESEEAQDAEAVVSDADNEREGFLGIKLTEAATGQPIAGAHLWVSSNIKKVDDLELKTDTAGRVVFEIGTEKVNYLTIRAKAKGYVGKYIEWRPDSKGIEVPRQYFAQMKKCVPVGGFVKTTDGEPIENVTVCISSNFDPVTTDIDYFNETVKTDKEGRWIFEDFDPDSVDSYISLEHEIYVSLDRFSIRPNPELLINQTCVLFMQKGFTVSGYVRQADGTPIEGAQIYEGFSRFSDKSPKKTDAQGFYSFEQCVADKMVLTVMAKGYGPDLKNFLLESSLDNVDFVLQPGHRMPLRAVDIQGGPIEGVSITARYWRQYSKSQQCESIRVSGKTGPDGRAVIEDLPADEVLYTISKDGYTTLNKHPLSPSDQEQVLTLWPQGKLKGSVYDAQTGELVKDCRMIEGIQWQGQQKPTWQSHHVKFCDQGRYELPFYYHVPEGFAVRIEADGYLPFESETYFNEGKEVTLDVYLQKGQGLAGVVYDSDGNPANGADVLVCVKGGWLRIRNGRFDQTSSDRLKTNANGEFVLGPQQAEFILVVLHESGFAQVTQEALLAAGEIRLQKWGRIKGTVYSGRKPAVNCQISVDEAFDESGGFQIISNTEAYSDEKGQFSLDRVVPGRAFLRRGIKLSGGSTRFDSGTYIQIEPGETKEVHIGGGGRTVKGRFTAASSMAIDFTENEFQVMPDLTDPRSHMDLSSLPEVEIPKTLFVMTAEEQNAWQTAWMATHDGKAFMEKVSQVVSEIQGGYVVSVHPDGSFTIPDVPPGRYLVWGRFQDITKKGENYEYYSSCAAQVEFSFVVEDTEDEKEFEKPVQIGSFMLKESQRVEIGKTAPEIAMRDMDKRKLSLQDFRGRYLLLDLAGNNLLGDRDPEQVRILKEASGAYREKGLKVVSVGIGGSTFFPNWTNVPAAIKYAFEQKGIDWVFAFEELPALLPSRCQNDYVVGGRTAGFVLIGPDGRVLEILFNIEEVAGAVEKHLGPR